MFPFRDHNPSERMPYVTWALMGANILIFLSYATLEGRELGAFFDDWALFPNRVAAGQDMHGLMTAMFLHGDFLHLAGNMLFLWIFGDNLEDFFGHVGFILFYLLSGVLASAAQIIADPTSGIPNVGASGAIAGVMGGYLLLFPKARVDVAIILGFFIQMITVPAWTMLCLWMAIQVGGGLVADMSGGGVAYWAHIGGFVAGLALVGVWLALGRRPERVDLRPDHPPTFPGTRSRVPLVRRSR